MRLIEFPVPLLPQPQVGVCPRTAGDRRVVVQARDAAVVEEGKAKGKLAEGVYIFVANGNGEQWTLRENRRAFGDYAFAPHRMGGVVRDRIGTSVTILGGRSPYPVFVSPMGSHGMVHPEAEAATARGVAKSGGLLCVSSASSIPPEEIARAAEGPKWFQMYGAQRHRPARGDQGPDARGGRHRGGEGRRRAAAIQVSNHGGRALDGTPATITVLPRIADAVQDGVPIVFDSGTRRGTDAARALARGADAVAAGRCGGR